MVLMEFTNQGAHWNDVGSFFKLTSLNPISRDMDSVELN